MEGAGDETGVAVAVVVVNVVLAGWGAAGVGEAALLVQVLLPTMAATRPMITIAPPTASAPR
jgi:uncharacterized membrane protein